jgi:hypothetical protein
MRYSLTMRVFFLPLLFLPSVLLCQPSSLKDSLSAAFDEAPRLVVRFETRNSFVTGKPAHVRGLKAGYQFGETVVLGVGYHWLERKLTQELVVNTPDGQEVVDAEIRMDYVSAHFDYTFYRQNNWYVSIPVQLGFGRSSLEYDLEGDSRKTRFGSMVLYEPAMSVEYRLLKYIGLGAGVGYRLMLLNNKGIDGNFNSPTYSLRVRLLLGKIYQDWVRNNE